MSEKLTATLETAPTPRYVTLETSLEVLDEQARPILEHVDVVYESAPDEVKQRIEALGEMIDTANELASENGTPQPAWSSFFEAAQDVPEEWKAGMLAYEALANEAERILAELDECGPEKAAVVLGKAEKLEARLDYEKLIKEAFETEHEYAGPHPKTVKLLEDISWAVAMRKNLAETPELPTYSQLSSIESYLLRLEEMWSERGILKESLEETSFEKIDVMPLEEKIAAIEAQIKDADEIRQIYGGWRRRFYYNKMPVRPKNKLYGIIDYFKEVQNEAQSNPDPWSFNARAYNEQLEAAFGDMLTKRVRELPPFEYELDIHSDSYKTLTEQAKMIDATEALQNIEVIGLGDNLPFAYTEAQLKFLLRTFVPPIALAAVDRIEFRALTEEEDAEDTTLGFHDPANKNGNTIVISDKQVWDTFHYYRQYGDPDQAKSVAEFLMENTVIHEFAHALEDELPVAIMKYWHEQCENDNTFVTSYVKRCFDEDRQNKYLEDFAESMKLYIMQPGTLLDLSPIRASAQYKIWQDFLPNPSTLHVHKTTAQELSLSETARSEVAKW